MSDSNFSFLAAHWTILRPAATQAESYTLRDPRAAAIYARRTLELALKWLFANDTALKAPYEKSLAAMIHEPTFAQNIRQGLFHDIKFIHRLGNLAAHGEQDISTQESLKATVALHTFLGWLARVYTKEGEAPAPFNVSLLPKAGTAAHQLDKKELQTLQEQLQAKDAVTAAAQQKLSQTEAELAQLKEQLALLQEIKQANSQLLGSGEYTEAQTRELVIDVMLREAGWDPKAQHHAEYEVTNCMPTAGGDNSGTGDVDYVLWGADGKPLALVEAKKTRKDPRVGKRQAALYADGLEQHHGQRPLIYYSNGYTTWLWDDQFYPPREVQGFMTRDELQWRLNQRSGRQDLALMQPRAEIAQRYYQQEAAARVMAQFGSKRKRKALIVMATGTGKTRLAIALVDMLMRAGWVRKALFLADRRSLVRQAKREFTLHAPNLSSISLLERTTVEQRAAARVVFSTYPTILNLIDGTRRDLDEVYSAGHFDLVIIDEAHRSVYQKYGAIFDYFDSLLLGLTATPRGEVDRNTYRLFELDDHQPTYAYELDKAVADEFLVPPRAIAVPLKFLRDGIKYKDLTPGEQEEYEQQARFYDDDGNLKEEIDPPALNQWLFNGDTIDKVLMTLMEKGLKVAGGDKLGKTIVFAKSSKHADAIVARFDQNYPHYAGHFCQKIDYSLNYAESLIDSFKLKEKPPQIAVSVDMLDTGIDVPEVLNLVFFKLVRSKTKFWQMIGRGTRLCPDLFGPSKDKAEFLIFDYCQNLEFFDSNPDGYESRPQPSIRQQVFRRRLTLATALQQGQAAEKSLRELSNKLLDQLHGTVASMNLDNFIVRQQRREVERFSKREAWNALKDEDRTLLDEDISGLPVPDEDDEYCRRFDLLILNLQLSVLGKSKAQDGYILRVRDIARGLEGKSTIPAIAKELELILALQTDEWWVGVTLPMLEEVRLRLRHLLRFVDPEDGLADVYTDFEDEFAVEGPKEYQLVKADPKLQDYQRRVRRFLHEHRDHVTIRRLRNNQPVTPKDIEALSLILFAEGGPIPQDEYVNIYGDQPLGVLVRSVVGLERNAAKQAFADFLNEAPLHPDQISFLNEVVEYLVRNGVMEPGVMFETPFTHFHDQGLVGVFGEKRGRKVVELVRHINRNADVA